MINNKKNRVRIIYLLAFLIPVSVMVITCAIHGIWPFGGNTIMTGDTTFQYVDYLSYYKTILFGNNDFAYSLSKNMGGEMAGFAAYYLYSPLNLLTLPFPKEWLFVGISLIIVAVPGLASLSMCCVLRHIDEEKTDMALILSLCYGLSGYVVVYNELFQYYVNIILLPFIVLWLRDILKSKGGLHIRYILILAMAVINNYYTGYMICLFLILYSVYFLLCSDTPLRNALKSFFLFAANSLLAAGLSCFVLIPAVLSLRGEKDNLYISLQVLFSPWTYFSKLYSGSFFGDFGAGRPNVYCGVIVTLMLCFLLADKRIGVRKRILTAAMLLFFWADFCINILNTVWHGFNMPIGFPYRQAFLVICFCIITAYEHSDPELAGYSRKTAPAVLAVYALYTVLVFVKRVDNTDPVSIAVTTVSVVTMICAVAVFDQKSAFKRISRRRVRQVYKYRLLLCLTIADLMFNAAYSYYHFSFTEVEEFQQPLSRISEPLDYIKMTDDNSVYRTEKDFRRSNNDAMMLDYAGLTHFSSSEKKATINYIGDYGFRNNGNWAMYNSTNTALADSILGVRYLVSQFDAIGKPYGVLSDDFGSECTVYKNPYALPIMMAAHDSVVEPVQTDDPFEYQNNIADAISGEKNNILKLQTAKVSALENGAVRYDLTVEDRGILYAFFDAPGLQEATVYLDGDEWGDYFGEYDWHVIDLLKYEPGEKVSVEIRPSSDSDIQVDTGYFAVMDEDALKKWSSGIQEEYTDLKKLTSSRYAGEYDISGNTLLFSLPMDTGWHLYVEDKEYPLFEACGHMMAATVPSGKHAVEIRFISPGHYIGLSISIASLLVMILYIVIYSRHSSIYGQEKNISKKQRNS